ncbi:MAG: hypothetical protein H8E47_04750 [Anaerolineales bacterium]|nr:hypothetical protein [Anaerolineales bacterium]
MDEIAPILGGTQEDKTQKQLINELVEMRQRVAELEAVDTERKRAEKTPRESKASCIVSLL